MNSYSLLEEEENATHLNGIIEFNELDDCNEYNAFKYLFKGGGKSYTH